VTEHPYWSLEQAHAYEPLLPGEEIVISRVVHINAVAGWKLTLAANVTAWSVPDPSPGNNIASVTVDVVEPRSRRRPQNGSRQNVP
jgi:hypothetical protein